MQTDGPEAPEPETSTSEGPGEAQLKLVRALAAALDTGAEAEAALQPFFARQLPVDAELDPFRRWAAELRRRTLPQPPADQLRRSAEHLDQFARALAEVAARVDTAPPTEVADRVDTAPLAEVSTLAAGWSDRLWDDRSEAVSIYNEVRSVLAQLVRLRATVLRHRPETGRRGREPR